MSGPHFGPRPGILPDERSTASHPAVFPKLAIIVPCYNEEDCLAPTLDELLDVLARATFSWEVIVVDDGSRDRSVEIAEGYVAKDARLRVVKHRTNMGSGQAIWVLATGPIVRRSPSSW